MYYAIYFSPTFNTMRACKYFCDGEYNSIDLCKDIVEYSLTEDDIAIIGVPSFGGRAPKMAIDRLKKIKGNGSRCVLISSYGNRASEDTLIELYDTVKNQGFRVASAMELAGRHSIFKDVAKDRPDGVDLLDYAKFKIAIKEKLNSNKCDDFTIPGNRPYKEVKESTLVPITDEACIGCNDCVRGCPASAINKDDPKITDASLCIHCMRCIEVCRFGYKKIDLETYNAMYSRLKDKFSGRKPNNLYI